MMYIPFEWLFIIALVIGLSIRIVREDHRIVVLRTRTLLKSRGAGPGLVDPSARQGYKSEFDQGFPGMAGLAENRTRGEDKGLYC